MFHSTQFNFALSILTELSILSVKLADWFAYEVSRCLYAIVGCTFNGKFNYKALNLQFTSIFQQN